jgi:RNA polymerase sigma factor (sigma-70 family)
MKNDQPEEDDLDFLQVEVPGLDDAAPMDATDAPSDDRRIRLERDEERELIRKAKAGDQRAMARLIKAHTAFVMKVAKRFTLPTWVSLEDVRQEGIIGLIDAVNRFNLEKYGNKFLAYAYWRIHKAILGYLTEMGYSMKIPFQDVMKLKAAWNRLDFNLSVDIAADTDLVNDQRSIHMWHLLSGCLPISPTDVYQPSAGNLESGGTDGFQDLTLKHDAMDDVMSDLLAREIEDKLGELTAIEGVMLSMYLGLYFKKTPMAIKHIAGEPSKVEDVGEHILLHPGAAGFGLEVGETYNNCSRLIKESEAKFRSILKEFYGNLYEHWRQDS